MTDGLHIPGSFDRVSADEVGGEKVPRVKLVGGADGEMLDAAEVRVAGSVLEEVLRELRIANMHLSIISNHEIKSRDLSDGDH
jgi:hypothetical protein